MSALPRATTGEELFLETKRAYGWNNDNDSDSDNDNEVKLLYKGKKLQPSSDAVFTDFKGVPKKTPKIIVMATASSTISKVANQKSDPLIRGLDHELQRDRENSNRNSQGAGGATSSFWGRHSGQDRNYKFCKLEACTWQSFGHRPTDQTPHAFAARRMLERLATDPGIVAIMKERELVVNTLGEMDPIDDRIMQKKQQESSGHAVVLGYNTNRGLRIDLKLRTDDLSDFRPYPELVSTLIHELSHNWVSDHDLMFWLNFAQMRAEYLYHHAHHSDTLVDGSSLTTLAGLGKLTPNHILPNILQELTRDMAQHGLHPAMIQEPIQQRCQELDRIYAASSTKQRRLGEGKTTGTRSGNNNGTSSDESKAGSGSGSARERALAAAEERRRQGGQQKKE